MRSTDFKGFEDRKALVTGAASGLGRALAVELARAGADVAVVDINEAGLQETARLVEAEGRGCLARRVDVASRAEMEALSEGVLSEWGRVDILVNNAGVGVGGELKDIPLDDIEWIVGINLMGEVYGTRLFLPGMIERGEGHIVNVASLSALVVLPFHIPYTTTKFALAGFTEALWAEARHHNVGVTLVCPGAMKTGIMDGTRLAPGSASRVGLAEKWSELLITRGMPPEEAARRILWAVERRRFLLLLGTEAYLLYYARRIAPGLMRRIVGRLTAFCQKR